MNIGDRPLLLLFDIDGTMMLRASGSHAASLLAALRQVHGIGEPQRPFETAGRTDAAIARTILLDAGIAAERIEAAAADVVAATVEEYAVRVEDDLSPLQAPGVVDLLDLLSAAASEYRLSLVTGNIEAVARIKLDRAGLGDYFSAGQGGFGSDHEDRAVLPMLARQRAAAGVDDPHPRERTVVIGDTPHDIACARADGVAVVAVTTGPFAREQLLAADAVIDHLRELPAALAQVVA